MSDVQDIPVNAAPDAAQDEALAVRRLKLWIRMLGITRTVENRLRDALRVDHDTTLPRFDVMAALWRNRDGLTMTELSRLLLVSNGNATAVVDRLVSDGLVARSPCDEDRRRVRVALTPEGLAQFERVAADHRALIDRLFSGLTDADLDAAKLLMRRMKEDLQ
ncbi:MarR family winged helix-turn-helix transcriptional regulator [Paracoccus panacisoli]|uniref:MarR family winged helix-turn-helix transcriptional regulator n=1 Tax=Paracoccus panacisoli TaxID=1510163 RepID=A0ABV6T4S5_9RHOB